MTNFDSFSEDLVPRITPQPAFIPAMNISKPIVPEVSIIFDEKKLDAEQPKSYKQWRDKQRTPVVPVNSVEGNATGAKNKFVKFDCVDLNGSEQPRQSVPTYPAAPFIDMNSCRMNAVKSSESRTSNGNMNGIALNQFTAESRDRHSTVALNVPHQTHQSAATIGASPNNAVVSMPKPTVTVEEMYQLMSLQQKRIESNGTQNTPNVQSPPPSITNATNATPGQNQITLNDIFQLFLQTQQRPEPPLQPINIVTTPVQTIEQHVPVAKEIPMDLSRPEDSDPSLKDLFHIIVKQQEQLINIQKQVQAILVQNNDRSPYNEHHRPICDAYNQFNSAPNPMGVMTSLEINVQKYSHNKKTSSDQKLVPPSLDRPNKENALQCCTNCQSPMNQNAPGKADTSDETDENSPNDWTIYGNILNQVNHVLQNSPVNGDSSKAKQPRQKISQNHLDSPTPSSASSSPKCNVFGPTPSHIRFQEFQQIGLKFDDVNVSATSKRVTFDTTTNGMKRAQPPTSDQSTTTDKSVIMNALAMKYLPIEQRQQSSPNNASPTANQVTLTQTMTTAAYNTPPNRQSLRSPSDMSIASYRYMEKYGLL